MQMISLHDINTKMCMYCQKHFLKPSHLTDNFGSCSVSMHVLVKIFSLTEPSQLPLWKLLTINACTAKNIFSNQAISLITLKSVREQLASTLALSNTLQHLNAISAKSSLIPCVILLNTLTHKGSLQ